MNRIPTLSYVTTFAFALSVGTLLCVCASFAADLTDTQPAAKRAKSPRHAPATTMASGRPARKDAGGVEEITVRSTRRTQRSSTIPASIVALSGNTLQTTGVRDALTLAHDVPGLMAETTSGSANPRYRLRGIGTNDFSANMTTAVGVSEDDVFLDSGASQGYRSMIWTMSRYSVARRAHCRARIPQRAPSITIPNDPPIIWTATCGARLAIMGGWGRKGRLAALLSRIA
ncbi:Plug domain-containing protein [Komagataeibacter xylinus]|uniref:Plug domain-containing protein n=1 Tax=Komagataeibacter xylinus TaxID=28448 RepID=UPI001F0D9914|nr:Plug domain-containing protein [Komagataeibacter xylinus]